MRKYFALTTALAAAFAAPAFAGALIFEPAPEPAVEVAPAPLAPPPPVVTWTGPYAGVHVGWGEVEVEDFGVLDLDTDDDGLVYGAQLGFDTELAGFVVGAEASYSRFEAEPDPFEIDHMARLLARAGYSLGRTLLYAKGGGFWADVDGLGEDFGWVAGGGVEHLITNNVSAGVEYLYHQKDDFDDTGADLNAQTVAARVNFRF